MVEVIYGTWLRGDQRGSIDRFHNRYGSPYLPRNDSLRDYNKKTKNQAINPQAKRRMAIKKAIREICSIRKWCLYALNVRSNHIHTVVAATNGKPELVLGAFKANATRELRENGLWRHAFTPGADGGSKRRLGTERSVAEAIDYVLHGQ